MGEIKSIAALVIAVIIVFWILKLVFKSMGLIIRLGITVVFALFLFTLLRNIIH